MTAGCLINLTFRRFGAAFEVNFVLCQLGGVSRLHSNPWLGALGCWHRNVQMVLLPLCRRRCKLYPEIFLHSWMGRTQAMESACMYGLRWTERVCTYIGPMTPVLRLTRRDLNSSDLSHIAAAWGPDPIRGRHLLCQDLCQAGEPEAGRGFILAL